ERSSTARNCAALISPFWCFSRACNSSGGRNKLPTWFARNGAAFSTAMTRALSYSWCSSTIFLRLVISPQEPASPQRTAAYQNSAMRFVSPNAPELVENAKRIKCPVLFIRGDQEPMENYPAERFKENCAGPCEVTIIGTAITSTLGRKRECRKL